MNKIMTIMTSLTVAGVFVLGLLLLMALLVVPTPQQTETEERSYPTPQNIEEFNRQHCQLELDSNNNSNIYCKGE